MPYIDDDSKMTLDPPLDELIDAINLYRVGDNLDGPMNYVITRLLNETFSKSGAANSWSYNKISRVRGCLVGVLDEFNRRVAHPYEDKKIRKNGDVY